MKTWNITLTAENEEEALELIKVMKSTFEFAAKFKEPLHHIYADRKRKCQSKLICEVEKK
jgi:hypothetical protein